jgi:hypothetical protein
VHARVTGSLESWAEGLREAGVRVHSGKEDGDRSVDLVVSAAGDVGRSVLFAAPMMLVEGRGARRRLRREYPVVERFLSVPSVIAPTLIVPLAYGAALEYAISHWSLAQSVRRRMRNRLARSRLARQALPALRPVVTVASRDPGPPFLIRAAASLGVPEGGEWFLTFGSADALTRAVFHVFAEHGHEPGWALKFARVPGYTDPFDRDELGLRIAAAAGELVRRRAPRLLGRFEAAGLPASVETEAVGSRMTHFLLSPSRRAEKVRAIETVAAWTLDVALATARPPDQLAEERRRLADEVVPRWRDRGVTIDIVERVGPVPGVLQHNDLGSWNIITRSVSEFTAVDWESARAVGFPLWDLVYFLTDALMHLDGASLGDNRRDAHNVRLFRGDVPSSEILFRWLHQSVEVLGIPEESVAPMITLCWLHHGLSGADRRARSDLRTPSDAAADVADAERIARLWMRTDGLGPGWAAWRRARVAGR